MSEHNGFVAIGTVLDHYEGPAVKELVIPEGITEIGQFGLRKSNLIGCWKIVFPTTLRVVGDYAMNFGGDSVKELEFLGDVESIGESAFDFAIQNGGLEKITFHGSVGQIKRMAFARAKITELDFANGVDTIGPDSFFRCQKLERVNAPTVKRVGKCAFQDCKALAEVVISPKAAIGEDAFQDCKKLVKDGMFAINGVLVHLDRGLEIPENIHTIDALALRGGVVKVPMSVRTIHHQTYTVKLRFPEEYFLTDQKLSGTAIFSDLQYRTLRTDEVAAVHLFQSGKRFEEIIALDLQKDHDRLVREMVRLLQTKGKAKHYLRAVEFVMTHAEKVCPDTIRSLYDVGVQKKYQKEYPLLERYLPDVKSEEAPAAPKQDLTARFREAFEPHLLEKAFKAQKGHKFFLKNVRMKDGEAAPEFLVLCAVAPYLEQYTQRPRQIGGYKTDFISVRIVPMADQAAKLLDLESLRNMLEESYIQGTSGWLLPMCRYGTGEQVTNLLTNMRRWEDWNSYGSSGRSDIITARGALMLSDTREAMMALDKCGALRAYANLRGTDEDSLRDTVLADFGLDSAGKCLYDLGGRTVEVSVAADLSLKLWDVTAGKEVKSLPKKDADPDLHAMASASLSDMKKNLKKVVKARNDLLFDQFLSGEKRAASGWKTSYLNNPVLNMVARLVVWTQGKKTFILTENGPVDCRGNAFVIADDLPIGVAHPIEMEDEVVQQWRKYLCANGLLQPFEQMWEPAHSSRSVTADRYEGLQVSVFRFMRNEKHGISFYDNDFHNDIGFWLRDCDLDFTRTTWHRHEIGQDETFTLGKFSFRRYNRRVNHLVYLLDKWTVLERIVKDDVTVEKILPSFTLAQITEFLRLAMENGSTNVTALLLNYKNQTFSDFDPMAEFSLDL